MHVMGSCADFTSAFFRCFFGMFVGNSKSDDDVSFLRSPSLIKSPRSLPDRTDLVNRYQSRQTLLVMPNLISAFRKLDCSTNVYWGTSAGRSQYFGDYFRGLAYAMSWPLVSDPSTSPRRHHRIRS
jgi:hypothetical protein